MDHSRVILKKISYIIGPLVFVIIRLLPLQLSHDQHNFLAIFSMVVCLWLFTSVPLFISGIIGVTLCVLFGIVQIKEAFDPFSDPIIFLFLGGFLLARALEITELDKKIANLVLSHKWVNQTPKRVLLAFYGLAFVLSMWISNTAAMALLLPISYGVIKKLDSSFGLKSDRLSEKIVLGLSYSATIGGNATPIGSPPNVIAIGLLRSLLGIKVGFFEWMLFALPISLLIFAFVFYKMTKDIPKEIENTKQEEIESYQKISTDQLNVVIVFFLTVGLWLIPCILRMLVTDTSSLARFLDQNLAPSVVSIGCASLLFLLPAFSHKKILTTHQVGQIDWPSLLLFGSGLSLGKILFNSGLASIAATSLDDFSQSMGFASLIIILLLVTIFATELASNTATANILIPVVLAFQITTGSDSIMPALLIAIACNSAFMLPVSTPPNAIAYGSGRVSKENMISQGIWLNFLVWMLLALVVTIFH